MLLASRYCSRECQAQDWLTHRKNCKLSQAEQNVAKEIVTDTQVAAGSNQPKPHSTPKLSADYIGHIAISLAVCQSNQQNNELTPLDDQPFL